MCALESTIIDPEISSPSNVIEEFSPTVSVTDDVCRTLLKRHPTPQLTEKYLKYKPGATDKQNKGFNC